jgi:hypothetical protein
MGIKEELLDLDFEEHPETEEIDNIRTMLTYILINNTDLDLDTIYSIVFKDGGNITWH